MFEWLKNKFNKKDEDEIKNKESNEKEELSQGEESDLESINNSPEKNSEDLNNKNLTNEKESKKEFSTDNNIENNIEEKSGLKDKEIIVEDTNELDSNEEVINKDKNIPEISEINQDNKEESINIEVKDELAQEVEPVEKKKPSLFQRLKDGLDKTRKEVGIKINTVLGAYVKIDDEMLEDLEDILISADIGMQTTMQLIDNLRETIIRNKVNDPKEVKPLLMEEAKKLMNPELNEKIKSTPPTIILVVGVNGVGKTTTIGKLSARFKNENKSVLVCAADTFRAAAIDQLKEWGNRANVDIISHDEGSDPASVVFDAIAAAKARGTDVLIVDTAGRLHNKANLMKELEKINKIITKNYPEANRENLLVLDATTGQNAMNQAKTFKEATDLTGIALTKLDGTAKGGVVIALQSELEIPIKLIGVGEGINDLQDFDIDSFIEAIFN